MSVRVSHPPTTPTEAAESVRRDEREALAMGAMPERAPASWLLWDSLYWRLCTSYGVTPLDHVTAQAELRRGAANGNAFAIARLVARRPDCRGSEVKP